VKVAKPVVLHVVSSEEDTATRRLHQLIRQRDALRPAFRAIWDELSEHFDTPELEAWAGAVLTLAHVNAGPGCLMAYWDVSKSEAVVSGIAPLLAAGQMSADICRHAGAQAATAALRAVPIARRALGSGTALARWWRMMETLARQASESVGPAAVSMSEILTPGTIDAFEDFVAAGLKFASGSKTRRLAFFTLQDELARSMIARDIGSVTFLEAEVELRAFVTALWGRKPLLRSFPVDNGQTSQRRSSIAGPLIRLPEIYRGVQGEAARVLFRAAAAHAHAHLTLGQGPFPVGTLKPLQMALVTLIEDARIETLAVRQLPGLRRLWSPYHLASPSGVVAAPTLLARLARGLFDPSYVDDDSFVAKGRAMFAAALPRIGDSAISREIGMLLGNDLGQMRVQFNAKTYVVEPVYRDDGSGMWDLGDDAPSGEVLELTIDAVRMERQEKSDDDNTNTESEPDDRGLSVGRGRPVAPDDRGLIIAKYPEWDHMHGVERPEWTVVREVPVRVDDPRVITEALNHADVLRTRIERLVRGVRIGRTIRLNRQHEGHDLDIDAVLEAGIALRTGREPDPRVFRSSTSMHRDLAALLLIDISESTRDRLASGTTVLDVERLAVAVLAEAMDRLGDPFSLLAFASDGREDVKMTTVKSFSEPYNRTCMARLAGLKSGFSTRLGAALRHAGHVIGQANFGRKLVIVLTDGEPSDIDVSDPLDLVEDARHAATGLHGGGIDAYGVVLGQPGMQAASRIFGRGNTMLVRRIEDLPGRLSELYFRLARR
jgi:nitric oxide reductase NorD protein